MNNEIEELPKEINGCISLTTLQVDGNHLNYIPREILDLEFLQDFSASRNNLKCLPLGFKLHLFFLQKMYIR